RKLTFKFCKDGKEIVIQTDLIDNNLVQFGMKFITFWLRNRVGGTGYLATPMIDMTVGNISLVDQFE
ncbi:3709_t:CDS:2, partial [Dentiscutata heterogama]